MPGTDLIKPSDLLQKIEKGVVTADLAADDYEEERKRWRNGGTAKDHAIARALQEEEDGRVLINLDTVLRGGGHSYNDGRNDSLLPSLAVAPPHAKFVRMRIRRDGELDYWTGRRPASAWHMKLDFGYTWQRGEYEAYRRVATIPPMPPDVRSLCEKGYLVLWEPFWRKTQRRAAGAPVQADPALLEPISGSLYIVRAVWELTALEAAALRA